MRGRIGHGTKLEYKQGVGQYTEVARLTDIGGLGFGEAEEVDVTGYDSPSRYREYITGLIDTDETTITGVWTAHDSQKNLPTMQEQVVEWRVTLPGDLGVYTCEGFIRTFELSPPVDDRIEFTATIRWTGKPDLNVGGTGTSGGTTASRPGGDAK